jgi:hypothetical protein
LVLSNNQDHSVCQGAWLYVLIDDIHVLKISSAPFLLDLGKKNQPEKMWFYYKNRLYISFSSVFLLQVCLNTLHCQIGSFMSCDNYWEFKQWCRDYPAIIAIIVIVFVVLIISISCCCGICNCIGNLCCCCKCFKPCRRAGAKCRKRTAEKRRERQAEKRHNNKTEKRRKRHAENCYKNRILV